MRAFLTALQIPQKSAQEWVKEGIALYGFKQYEEAIAAYDQAIRLNPNYADAYNNKGLALDQFGRKREAQQAYEKAKQLGYGS